MTPKQNLSIFNNNNNVRGTGCVHADRGSIVASLPSLLPSIRVRLQDFLMLDQTPFTLGPGLAQRHQEILLARLLLVRGTLAFSFLALLLSRSFGLVFLTVRSVVCKHF